MSAHKSKIERLIEELCPEGVEYKRIEEVCKNISTGGTPSTSNLAFYNGDIPWLRTQDVNWSDIYNTSAFITELGLRNSSAKIIPINCVIVAMYGATAAKVAINKIPLTTNQACCNLDTDSRQVMYRFVFYWLSHSYLKLKSLGEGSQSNINSKKIKDYKIPVPPMEVQEEIVRILDSFTQLEAELEAELEARKKQYDHYKKYLLTHLEDTKELTLGELFDMKAGKSIQSIDISIHKTNDFIIPCYGGNGLRGYVKQSSHSGKYVLIGRQGALCGNIKRVEGEFYATEHAVVVKEKYDVNIDWAFHFLNYLDLNQYATISAQPGLSVGKIETIPVRIPSKLRQEQIAKILDKFEALVNDISIGLPAELAARRKQYEYYRNKLLTFKEREQG